jgi:uncharacterized protein (TIGR03000 family)
MYSLVLMTVMTTSPDAAEFNGFFRNLFHGGNGCAGTSRGGCYGSYAPRYSCYGGGCSGGAAYNCSGSAGYAAGCNGCCGCNGEGLLSRVRKLFDRGGCCGGGCCGGGCCGGGCCGGFGSGYGNSCYGSSPYSYFGAGLSCQGGMPYPAPPPGFEPYPYAPSTPAPPPSIPFAPPEVAPPGVQAGRGQPTGDVGSTLVSGGGQGARATVTIRVPADAKLFADSRPLNLTGAERKFVTPGLPDGQEFLYRFRVEYDRDGETVSVTKKVFVKAGASVGVEFTDLMAKQTPEKKPAAEPNPNPTIPASLTAAGNSAVPSVMPPPPTPVTAASSPAATQPPAAERATITVKLPAGAALYVDDRKSPSNEAVRRFSTPPLPGGREYAYLMRAEIVRNGQTETFTQKVPFRAGERVDVDFTSGGR